MQEPYHVDDPSPSSISESPEIACGLHPIAYIRVSNCRKIAIVKGWLRAAAGTPYQPRRTLTCRAGADDHRAPDRPTRAPNGTGDPSKPRLQNGSPGSAAPRKKLPWLQRHPLAPKRA